MSPSQERASRGSEAAGRMLELLNSFITVQALHTAVALNVPDLLDATPSTPDELAVATGAHPPSLRRLLRMLVGGAITGPGLWDTGSYGPTSSGDDRGGERDEQAADRKRYLPGDRA